MKSLLRLLVFAAVAVATTGSLAAEPETPSVQPPKETPTPAAAEAEKTAQSAVPSAAEPSEADKDPAEKGSAAKGSPQRFIPSEQVRADFDVSFPIDI